jgi:hypothetical protein
LVVEKVVKTTLLLNMKRRINIMTKEIKKLPTAKETLDIINKPWCTVEDIMLLTGMGRNFAFNLKKEINKTIEDDGFKVLDCYVPTDRLIGYLNLDIEYLKKISNLLSEEE